LNGLALVSEASHQVKRIGDDVLHRHDVVSVDLKYDLVRMRVLATNCKRRFDPFAAKVTGVAKNKQIGTPNNLVYSSTGWVGDQIAAIHGVKDA